jgi:tetratricopeptide (TPR) repeat protein
MAGRWLSAYPDAAWNSHIFHLLGADQEQGLLELRRVYEERREHSRFSEAEVLVKLFAEYRPVLKLPELAWLEFFEAQVAIDARNWREARVHLEGLLSQELPLDLRSVVILRLATVQRNLGDLEKARESGLQALSLIDISPKAALPKRMIHHELGVIARDRGDFDEARSQLGLAVDMAKSEGDRLDLAAAYNSLGTLLLKPLPHEAVEFFEKALQLLDRRTEPVRIAQVLNNLAMANADMGEWKKSESFYHESLEIKKHAGDLFGQALGLLNVARSYRALSKESEARAALTQSSSLFEVVRDARNAANARRELARLLHRLENAEEASREAAAASNLLEVLGETDEAAAIRREFKLGNRGEANLYVRIIVAVLLIASLAALAWMIS